MSPESDDMITTRKAAEMISLRTGRPVSQRQLRHEIQNGHLQGTKIAGTWFITQDDLLHYIRRKPGKALKR